VTKLSVTQASVATSNGRIHNRSRSRDITESAAVEALPTVTDLSEVSDSDVTSDGEVSRLAEAEIDISIYVHDCRTTTTMTDLCFAVQPSSACDGCAACTTEDVDVACDVAGTVALESELRRSS